MISSSDFVRQSLEVHLFFARIMKEHSFFLEIGFTPKDTNFTGQADSFRMEFDKLLMEVVSLSYGVVNPNVLQSGEVVTPYTLNAEMASSYFTGVQIPTEIAKRAYIALNGCMTGKCESLNIPVMNYTITKTTDKAIIAGCHTIPKEDIRYIANLLKWA